MCFIASNRWKPPPQCGTWRRTGSIGMIEGALKFLIQMLGNLFVIAVLLRFMMQLFRVPFRNPFAQFIVALTDFAVKPLRRVVPGLLGLDWACLVLARLVELAVVTGGYWLGGFPFGRGGGGGGG